MLERIINLATDALYRYILVILLVLGGLYFTVRSKEIGLPHETGYWN